MSWVENHLLDGYRDKAVEKLASDGEFQLKGIGTFEYTGNAIVFNEAQSFLERVKADAAAHAHRQFSKGT